MAEEGGMYLVDLLVGVGSLRFGLELLSPNYNTRQNTKTLNPILFFFPLLGAEIVYFHNT